MRKAISGKDAYYTSHVFTRVDAAGDYISANDF